MQRILIACAVVGALAGGTAPAQPGSAASFTVGTATAARGQKAFGAIEVPAGTDAALTIPVAVVHGARPGPVLAIVSGAHGTEYASIIAVERLIQQIDPATVSGTVILVPLVNVPSFEQKIAHVNPVDGKSMNRFYPGKMDGTQTERASFLITRQVVEPADHVIDLHGGDLGREPAAVLVLDQDRQREAGCDFARDAAGVRPRHHHHFGRPAEGPCRVAVPREHRQHARQAVDYRGGRARRDRRTGRRGRAGQRIALGDAVPEDAARSPDARPVASVDRAGC